MTSPGSREPAPARSALRLLIDPVFGGFFWGRLAAVIGIWIHNITAAIVVFDLTGSAAYVGAVSIVQFGPQLLLTPWAGARADSGNRRLQLVVGRLITGAGSGGLAIWVMTVGLEGTAGAAIVIVAAFIVGFGSAIGGPSMQALLPTLVRPAELSTAVALNSLPMSLARTAGPAAGAALVIFGGAALPFGLAAGGQLLFAGVMLFLSVDAPGTRPRRSDTSIRSGLRYLRRAPAVVAALVGTTAVGIGADPIITLGPSISDELGGDAHLVGALASAFGAGSVLAMPLISVSRRIFGQARLGVGGLVLLATGLAGLALSTYPAVAIGSLGLAGFGMTFALTVMMTAIHEGSPDHLRGRMMALWSIAFIGSRPLAAALNGLIADAANTDVALALVVLIVLGCAWYARPARLNTPAPDAPICQRTSGSGGES